MKYFLSIENDMDEVIYETVAPTLEILEERIGQWERSNAQKV